MPSQTAEAANGQGFQLYVMRHGIAAPRGAREFPDDYKRPLTDDGRKTMKAIAKGLARLDLRVDSVITSPLVRAAETAEIVAKGLDPAVPVEASDELRPGGSLQALMAHLGKYADRRSVLIVGHEPDLSDAVAKLVGAGRQTNFRFKKGGCCRIDFDDFPPHPPARLVWWITPAVMKKIGK